MPWAHGVRGARSSIIFQRQQPRKKTRSEEGATSKQLSVPPLSATAVLPGCPSPHICTMPSLADPLEIGGTSSSRASGSRSWHPLELGGASDDDVPPPIVVPLASRSNNSVHSSFQDEEEDTVSLLSDPGGRPGSPTLLRRRGGRRRGGRFGGRGGAYHPLAFSVGQVTDAESKACFPVYGCASFLLSILVAAIFFVPPPAHTTTTTDFASFICRHNVWQALGFEVDDNDANNNRTADQYWLSFVQSVDQTENTQRCRTTTPAISIPSDDPSDEEAMRCLCTNPTEAWQPEAVTGDDQASMEYAQLWQSAMNQQRTSLQTNETTLPLGTTLELVMVGDSLTEHWMGTSLGRPKAVYEDNAHVFASLLRDNHEVRPYIHTCAVGLSGDRCGQLLYRIRNRAVIPSEARLGILTVFWLWIGTNDIIRDNCRADQVAAGIVAIVRELRERRPDAWVVVQSLLPSENAPVSLVEKINAATACLADSTKKTIFYNSSSVFMLPQGVVNTSRFVDDGIHPNAEGSRVWGRSMLDFLRKLYEDRYIH